MLALRNRVESLGVVVSENRTTGAWCVMKESESFSCCSKDESRSLGFGDQKLEPNHHMRHSLRAIVVSDKEKTVQELSGTY